MPPPAEETEGKRRPPRPGGNVLLVTGGAGYVGTQLVHDVACDPRFDGWTIRILDNLQRETFSSFADLPGGDYEFIEGDVLDPSVLDIAVDGVSAVVHLAALVRTPFSFDHPTWTEHVNHWGVAHLVERCLEEGVSRFIFSSSASVYGTGGGFSETSACNPVGPYAQSKLRAERVLHAAVPRGLDPTILRLGTVFGFSPAVRFDAVPNRLAYLVAIGRSVTIHGSGDQKRPIVHVRDVSGAIRHCLTHEGLDDRLYNVAGENVTINGCYESLSRIRPFIRAHFTDQHVLTQFSLEMDSGRFRSTGWQPEVSLDEGLGEIIEHLGVFRNVRPTVEEEVDVTV